MWDQRARGWRTDLVSNSFSAMVYAVVRIVVHIGVCNENVEFAREGILLVRTLSPYLSGHLREMSGVSPHPMNKDLLPALIQNRTVLGCFDTH